MEARCVSVVKAVEVLAMATIPPSVSNLVVPNDVVTHVPLSLELR